MRTLIPSQPWHATGLSLQERMDLMQENLWIFGWRIFRRGRWTGWFLKRTTVTLHPIRVLVTRTSVDLEDEVDTMAEAVLFAHELAHVMQGGGSRVLWTLRYLLSPSFRRAIEEEAFAHGEALALVSGVRRSYPDPALLSPLYCLRRDEDTLSRVRARARDLVGFTQRRTP